MKLISWNVNGIRAVIRKDALYPMLTEQQPDILCLQETKAQPEQVADQVAADLPAYPYQYWHSAEKKGYSGTAVLSRHEPLNVGYGIDGHYSDNEGRALTLEFERCYIVTVYVPNAKRDLSRLDDRQDWDRGLLAYLNQLQQHKPVIWCGDLNVAHQEIDLARPKSNRGKHGFTDEERNGFQQFLDAGFIDSFRHRHPDQPDHYTWWQQFGGARERNVGWRIDYVMISSALLPALQSATILPQVMGSDHCPVAIEWRD